MLHSGQCGSCMGVCLWFVSSRQQLSAPWDICSQLTAVWYDMVRYTLEQPMWNAGRCWRKFCDERVPSRQTIHDLVNKLRTMGLLIDMEKKTHKRRVLTEEKLDHRGARLEHTPRKSPKHLAQDTGVSKSSARTATKLLKPSSESLCLACCKCKDCCMCVF
jgi:hypothetical protein